MAPGFHEDEITGVRMWRDRAPGGGGNENKIWIFHPEHKYHKGDDLRLCCSHYTPDCGAMLRVYPRGHNLSHPGFWNCYDLVKKSRIRTTNDNGSEDICQECFDLHAFRRLQDETEPRTVFRFTGFGEKTEDELMELFFTILREGFMKMAGEEYAAHPKAMEEHIRQQLEGIAEGVVGSILDARVKSAGASNDPQWQRRVTSIMEAQVSDFPAIARQIFPSNTWRRAPATPRQVKALNSDEESYGDLEEISEIIFSEMEEGSIGLLQTYEEHYAYHIHRDTVAEWRRGKGSMFCNAEDVKESL